MHSPLLQIAGVHGNGKQESGPALIEVVFSPNGNQLGKLSGVRADTGSSAPASSSRLVLPGQALTGDNSFELYGYDGFNRMVSANMSGAVTTYAYRPDGLRHSKRSGGVTTTHVWDGSNIALDISGSSVVKYIRGINLLFSDTAGVKAYFLYNGHGDVVNLTSAAGAVTKTYDYDAFGVERNPSAADANPWRYCGEYFDKETGTVYLRERIYDPGIGRFLSEDPAGDGLNWYTYCGGNPVAFVDPWGLAAYVFYDIDDYKVTAESFQKTLMKRYDLPKEEVILIPVSKAEDLTKGWNGMGADGVPIDAVIMIIHANPIEFAFKDDSRFTVNDFENLNNKDVGALILMSCNAGHVDYKTNMATEFAYKTMGGPVMASDGTPAIPLFFAGSRQIKSKGDSGYEDLRPDGSTRKNMGWIVYQIQSDGTVRGTATYNNSGSNNSYSMSINQMLDWMARSFPKTTSYPPRIK